MRPVTRGNCPQENGVDAVFTAYGEAREPLINRIGDFCSYCENQITNPAVEHIQPKIHNLNLALSWTNFLLACTNCNSIKGHDPIIATDYYWADIHNTYLLFDFYPGGVVVLKNNLHASVDPAIANNTIFLTGVSRYGSTAGDADRRWIKRAEVWSKAENVFLKYYVNNNRPADYIPSIISAATLSGFFGVWMTVFKDEQSVKTALIRAFPGTFNLCEITDINRN